MVQKKYQTTDLVYIVLVIFGFISMFPFYWMFVGATNPSGKLFSNPPTMFFGTELINNFKNLHSSINVGQIFFNSIFVAVVTTILSVLVSTMIAYGLVVYNFRGRKLIFALLIGSMMIPSQVMLVPLFKLMSYFNLLNSYVALIAPSICSPFAIFLMRQNLLFFPKDLLESARLDGAGELYIFFKIVLPNMKPALAATAIFMFMNSWNDFTWPLVAISETKMFTLPLALVSMVSVADTDYGRLMLGITLATIPIIALFLFLQKHFIAGMLNSGIK